MPVDVGLIGHRNHAAVIARLIEESGLARIARVYHPSKPVPTPTYTANFSDLLECDAVFVLSPNATHLGYLERLAAGFSGYIFCEKPPVVTKPEFDALVRLPLNRERTYFNFNLRHSQLRAVVADLQKTGSLGRLVWARAQVSHGLALRPGHDATWRATSGVLTNVNIHFVDLFLSLFGPAAEVTCRGSRVSGSGEAEDTALVQMVLSEGAFAESFVSYAAPYSYEVAVIGTEQALVYRDGVIEVRGPRETLDGEGRFSSPPVLMSEALPVRKMQRDSLSLSVRYFLEAVCDGSRIPTSVFEASLASTRAVVG